MITLHRLNDEDITLNEFHIEKIEARPDTVILLTNDRKYVVKETVEEIIEKIREFQRSVINKNIDS